MSPAALLSLSVPYGRTGEEMNGRATVSVSDGTAYERLCEIDELMMSTSTGSLVIAGLMRDPNPQASRFAHVVHVPGEEGVFVARHTFPGMVVQLPGPIEEIQILSDSGARMLLDGEHFEMDREAGWISFRTPNDEVSAIYRTADLDTFRICGAPDGRDENRRELDVRIDCDIDGVSMQIELGQPYVYTRGPGEWLQIRSSRYEIQ